MDLSDQNGNLRQSESDGIPADSVNPYMSFRRQVLGIQKKDYENYMRQYRVVAVLMDTNMADVMFSVACVVDGTFSLYYRTGGGVVGMGQKYKDLGMAARAFVYGADRALPNPVVTGDSEEENSEGATEEPVLEVVDHYDLPATDERIFYLVTDGKIFKAVSRKGSIATEPKEVQILNYTSEKVMDQFFECYQTEQGGER